MTKEDLQINLFNELGVKEKWKDEWKGMPEFIQEDLQPFQSVIVHFESRKDMDDFSKLVEQKLTYKTKSIWFPKAEIGVVKDIRWVDEPEEPKEKCYWCFLEAEKEDTRLVDGELLKIQSCSSCINLDLVELFMKKEQSNES